MNTIVEFDDWLRPLRSEGQRFARALEDAPEEIRAARARRRRLTNVDESNLSSTARS